MFWKRIYKSKYTGREIDAAVAKAADATKVTANPSLAGTEAALTGLEVGTTKYKVEQPINVVANPTLAGTESALEGLQVGNTKYKVGGDESVMILAFTSQTALNKSYAEVLAAIQNGVPLLLREPEVGTLMNCVINTPATNVIHLQFAQTGYNSVGNVGQMVIFSIDYNSDDTFTIVPAMYSFTVTAME